MAKSTQLPAVGHSSLLFPSQGEYPQILSHSFINRLNTDSLLGMRDRNNIFKKNLDFWRACVNITLNNNKTQPTYLKLLLLFSLLFLLWYMLPSSIQYSFLHFIMFIIVEVYHPYQNICPIGQVYLAVLSTVFPKTQKKCLI